MQTPLWIPGDPPRPSRHTQSASGASGQSRPRGWWSDVRVQSSLCWGALHTSQVRVDRPAGLGECPQSVQTLGNWQTCNIRAVNPEERGDTQGQCGPSGGTGRGPLPQYIRPRRGGKDPHQIRLDWGTAEAPAPACFPAESGIESRSRSTHLGERAVEIARSLLFS